MAGEPAAHRRATALGPRPRRGGDRIELGDIRAELPVVERVAYLNAGSTGPLPRRAVEALTTAARRDLEEGRATRAYFEELLALRERAREAFRRLLGAPEGSIALTSSTTEACNIVLTGLGLGPGDEVVTTDFEHPGLFGGLVASGATLQVVAVRDRSPADALALFDAAIGARTRLVAVSHVSWLTGAVLPVGELARRGVPLLVDGAQAAGAIPVDVGELGCDFYTVSAQKWLLGPDPSGCLYVRPDRVGDLRMTFPSYASWEPGTYEPRPDASRFDPGWISRGSLAALLASLAFADEIGPERFGRARRVADRLRAALAEGHHDVVGEAGQGTLVAWRAGDAEDAVKRLADAGVVVRELPGLGWLRASCGFWTSDDDLERLLGAL